MSTPNKYYLTEEVIECRNMEDSIGPLKMILKYGGIDNILLWCTRACLSFDHDLDKQIMTIFGGEVGLTYYYLKFKVREWDDKPATKTN